MRYPFPVRIPKEQDLIITQPYRVSEPVPLSETFKIQPVEHLGVDIVVGKFTDTWDKIQEQTWGTVCVWPFPFPGRVYDSRVDSEFGAKQYARCQIDGVDPDTGISYSVVYLHLSSVENTKAPTDTKVVTYTQGQSIGKIGNNGSVHPAPTPDRPLNGSHLHLALGIKKPGELNYTMVDPQQFFDVKNPFRSDDAIPATTPEVLPSEKLRLLGEDLLKTNPKQGRILLAVSSVLKAFGS